MTSATDELRRLLDERDEYYQTSGNKTWWGRPIDRQTGKPINVFHCQAQPMGEDRLFVELQLATPAQAIDATLGRGTCHIGRGISGLMHVTTGHCSECGAEVVKPARYCPNCGREVVNDQ